MGNGLFLSKDEFQSLPKNQQLVCLYENQLKTLNLIKGYKFNQKIQWAWLSALTFGLVFIVRQIVQIK